MLSATIASIFLAGAGAVFSLADWERWVIADGLSLLIILPIALVLVDAWRARKRPSRASIRSWAIMIVLVTSGTALIFAQSTFPFLFLTSPLVIYAAFRASLLGTAVAMLIITVIASIATTSGTGPISLVRGGSELQLIAFQAFLAANFSMGFPVAAMLTQRARDRLALLQERDEKQEILDNIRDIIFRTDPRGCWTSLNPAWEQLTGFTVAESLGWPTTKLLHPGDRARAEEIYPRLVTGEIDETTLHQRFVDRSGTCRHIEVSVRRLAAADGSFEGTIGNLRDVTTQVAQDQALAESEARFRRLAESAPVGIFRANAEGELTYINPGWAAKVGLTVEQMLGWGWLQAVADLEPLRKNPPFVGFKQGELRRRIIHFRAADGQDLWMETYNSAEFDEEGRVKGFYGAAVDVSDARQLETDLRFAQRRAEEAATAKSMFLANMSHEIRTPMNGVLGFTELLERSPLDESQRGYVQMIADSGREMMRLLNDILDISKIEAGQLRIVTEPIDLRHKLGGVIRLMEPIASEKGLGVVLDIAADIPTWVMGDPLRLRQVVLNLLGNAIKFTERGRICVVVSAVDAGRSLRIDVKDTGIGIAPENLDSVFQQFSQADNSIVRRFGGSGLGLAISKQLAEMMGGNISLASTVGVGSTFSVVVPLVPAVAPDHADAPQPGPSASLADKAVAPRLLIAEDNEINRQLIEEMVHSAGYTAHLVTDGEAAVRAVVEAESRGEPYSLVLMDLQMPLLDGLSATRLLRSKGYDAALLPIVALTANAYAEDIAQCRAAGMQAHIAKPLRMRDLVDAIERFTAKGGAQVEQPLDHVAATITDPALTKKYRDRKEALRAMLGDVTEFNIEERWRALAVALHQLAGVAAIFGDPILGETAAAIERDLELAPHNRARLVLVSDALAALNCDA